MEGRSMPMKKHRKEKNPKNQIQQYNQGPNYETDILEEDIVMGDDKSSCKLPSWCPITFDELKISDRYSMNELLRQSNLSKDQIRQCRLIRKRERNKVNRLKV